MEKSALDILFSSLLLLVSITEDPHLLNDLIQYNMNGGSFLITLSRPLFKHFYSSFQKILQSKLDLLDFKHLCAPLPFRSPNTSYAF